MHFEEVGGNPDLVLSPLDKLEEELLAGIMHRADGSGGCFGIFG